MELKRVVFVGPSREDLREFPEEVQKDIGHALCDAQKGIKPVEAKPLRGFGGAGVLEIIVNSYGDTYRAVYTVKFAQIIFVLHCFQIDLIKQRLKWAEDLYNLYYN